MAEKLNDQDVLLVKEKNSDELKVVKGINPESKKLDTVHPNLENQPDFMKIDRHGNALDNFMENFNRQFKNPTEFMFFKVPVNQAEEIAKSLDIALKMPEAPNYQKLLESYKIELPSAKKEFAINPDLVNWKKFEQYGVYTRGFGKIGYC